MDDKILLLVNAHWGVQLTLENPGGRGDRMQSKYADTVILSSDQGIFSVDIQTTFVDC